MIPDENFVRLRLRLSQLRAERGLTCHDLAAISLHELFLAYTAAGFTEDQALELVARILRQPDRD
jgi:hypothetical protein